MSKAEEQQNEQLRKLKQAVREGIVDYTCPNCSSMVRGEPDADRVWCSVCDKSVKVKRVI